MSFDDATKLIDEGKYEEAYEFFKEDFESTNNLMSKYYMAMIEFHYLNNKTIDELLIEFKELWKLPEYMHRALILPLISLSIDSENYDDVITYSKKALEMEIDLPIVYGAYAKGLFFQKRDLDLAVEYCSKAINHEEATIEMSAFAFETKMLILTYQKDYEAANTAINQMYLKYGTKSFIDFAKMKMIYQSSKNKEEIEECYNNLIGTEDEERAIRLMFDFYFQVDDSEKTIEFGNKILEEKDLSNEELFVCNLRMAFAYRALDNDDMAIEIMEQTALLNYRVSDVYYNIGETYFYKDTFKGFIKARDYFLKGYELLPSIGFMNYLADTYYYLADFSKMAVCIEEAKKLSKKEKNYYHLFLEAELNNCLGNFDLATKKINQALKKKVVNVEQYYNMIYLNDVRPVAATRYFKDRILNGKISAKIQASAYFHGEFTIEVNEELALNKAMEAISIEKNSCTYSLIGNILLNAKKYEEAFKYFEMGTDDYFSDKEFCSCCVPFLAYCYYLGLGVEENKEKAYDLLNDAILRSRQNVSENTANLYAYISLIENRNIENAYNFLQKFHERRYQTSTYYVLFLIAQKLEKKEAMMYYNEYGDSLIYTSIKEFEYYKDNPSFPYLNNN